jgi:hypothetical protein
MNGSRRAARLRAAGAAAFLLIAGAIMGIALDRLWLSPYGAQATPLTAAAMSDRLGLAPADQARIAALLDTLHGEISGAMVHGPDSVRAATAAAHRRIEASLPPEARPEFRAWMLGHQQHMMQRLHLGPGGMHPGGQGPGVRGMPQHRQAVPLQPEPDRADPDSR